VLEPQTKDMLVVKATVSLVIHIQLEEAVVLEH